jgi:hypothetical protein
MPPIKEVKQSVVSADCPQSRRGSLFMRLSVGHTPAYGRNKKPAFSFSLTEADPAESVHQRISHRGTLAGSAN